MRAVYDDTGAIGKLYARQDEIGTPFCVTIDFDSIGEGKEAANQRHVPSATAIHGIRFGCPSINCVIILVRKSSIDVYMRLFLKLPAISINFKFVSP